MPAEDGGGRNFDRQALQATLADLVRAAEETGDAVHADAAAVAGETGDAPAPAPRRRIPTVRAPGQKLDDEAGVPAAGPVAAVPHPSSQGTVQDAVPAPVPHPDGVRPPASGRPRLPFSPNPSPSPQGGPGGTVRPGAGGLGGAPSVRPPAFGGGVSPMALGDDSLGAPRTISASSGLPSLGSRIARDQGDNLARLAPTPVEQPTIAVRRRKPSAPAAPAHEEESHGHAAPAGHAPQPQAARATVAVEPWVPSYDDILPARSARTGRSFRLKK